jgi:hypothetical protein
VTRDAEDLARTYSNPHLDQAEPCPFCGSTTLGIIEGPEARPVRSATWQILCAGCLCRGPLGVSPQQAVAKWNKDFGPIRRPDLGEPWPIP